MKTPPEQTQTEFYYEPYDTCANGEDETRVAPSAVVLHRDFTKGSLIEWAVHILGVGVTFGTVQLCLHEHYWTDQASWTTKWYWLNMNWDDVLKTLQYAAKGQGSLITASISAIVLHFVRRRLIGSKGITFGLLMGGYQATSIGYMISTQFWHGLRGKDLGLVGVAILIAFSFLLIQLVDPASAGVIQPTLNWWPVADPFNGQRLPMYLMAWQNMTYPLALDELYMENNVGQQNLTQLCFSNNDTMRSWCPGDGHDAIRAWATSNANEATTSNLTITEELGRAQRILSTSSANGYAISSTLSHWVVRSYGLFWQYLQSHPLGIANDISRPMFTSPEPIYAPVVQVQCQAVDFDVVSQSRFFGTPGFTFQPTVLTNFTDDGDFSYDTGAYFWVPHNIWNFSGPDIANNTVNFTWFDVSNWIYVDELNILHDTAPVSVQTVWQPSIGALITLPYLKDNNNTSTTQSRLLVPCVIDARWAAADVSYDPTTFNLVTSNVSDPALFVESTQPFSAKGIFPSLQRSQWGIRDPIRLTPSWADLLNTPSDVASDVSANGNSGTDASAVTAIEDLLSTYVVSELDNDTVRRQFVPPHFNVTMQVFEDNTASVVATLLSLVIADGLARVNSWSNSYLILENNNGSSVMLGDDLLFQAGAHSNVAPVNISWSAIAGDAVLTMQVKRYGWGYGLSAVVIFDIVVLFLYVAIVIAYILYKAMLVVLGRGWCTDAWGDPAELTRLALMSSSVDDLQTTERRGSSPWQQTIRIRERGVDRLELVAGPLRTELGSERLPEVGKGYR